MARSDCSLTFAVENSIMRISSPCDDEKAVASTKHTQPPSGGGGTPAQLVMRPPAGPAGPADAADAAADAADAAADASAAAASPTSAWSLQVRRL